MSIFIPINKHQPYLYIFVLSNYSEAEKTVKSEKLNLRFQVVNILQDTERLVIGSMIFQFVGPVKITSALQNAPSPGLWNWVLTSLDWHG